MGSLLIAKRIVDILMTLLYLILMANGLTGSAMHEILGLFILALFILHHLLNLDWYSSMCKGKQNPIRMLHTIVNALLFVDLVCIAVSAVMTSRFVFSFDGGLEAHKLHACATNWGLVFVSIHLGLHWNLMINGIKKYIKQKSNFMQRSICHILAAGIAIYGFYASFVHDIGSKLIMYYGYSFWDFENHTALFFVDYIAIMGMYICATYYIVKWAKAQRRIKKYE